MVTEPPVQRTFWLGKLEAAWERHSLIWLRGVRRVGKTCLCQSLADIDYFDCELPSVRRAMTDAEAFLKPLHGRQVVLDEVQRLSNPSELLKIATDHYPQVKILATGSSTLQASARFRDALTGRKTDIWLTPMIATDLVDFEGTSLERRLVLGGLPPFFLDRSLAEAEYQEWLDSYWAKDIQELFRLERRSSFQRLLEMLFVDSGGIFEATRYAAPCEISRQTVSNYLKVLEATMVCQVIKPFSKRSAAELVAAPKVYVFDTGFLAYYRGWNSLTLDSQGPLWEHYVLNEINAHLQGRHVHYWRDKQGHEVDFVLVERGGKPLAVECKWSADGFEPRNLKIFRRRHPEGENWIVCKDVARPFRRKVDDLDLHFMSLTDLVTRLPSLRI